MKTFKQFLYEEHNKYRFDRVPRAAQSLYDREGNSLLKAATSIAERSHDAIRDDQEEWTEIQPDRPNRRIARNLFSKKVRPQEEKDLITWAKTNNFLLSNDEFNKNWIRDGKKGESEHEVYYDEDNHTWVKRNNLSLHSTYLEYFHRILLHNYMFPEAPVTLIGFVINHNQLMPVVTQPHIHASRGASREEVQEYMKKLGYRYVPTDNYVNDEAGIRVEDLHDENVLVSPEGDLYIIDPIVYLTDEGKRKRLAAYSELEFPES